MPMPLWWGHLNKHIFNKRELKKGDRPVITHIGRSSGTRYHTPVDAHPVDDGFIFILVYGSQSDWVQNILASGTAQLSKGGAAWQLSRPQILDGDEAWQLLPPGTKRPPAFLRINEYLHMTQE